MNYRIETKFKKTEIGSIPEDWKVLKISDICDISSSKRIFFKEYVKSGVPFYRSKEIILKEKNNKINNLLFINEKKYNEIKNKFSVPQKGEILLTSVGTLGIPYFIKNNDKFYFKDGNLTWFKNFRELINSKFLYYWLKSGVAQKQINIITIGSTQKALTIDSLKNMKIGLMSINEQNIISKFLSDLDAKIDLNNKINSILEKISQLVFKHWFVDYEFPNEQGKPYKSSGGKFIDSELGKIPKGWKVGILKTYYDIVKGLSYKGKDILIKNHNVLVGLKCFKRGGGFRLEGIKGYKGDFKKEHLLKPGDLIVAMTDITQAADIIGKPAIIPELIDIKNIIASLDVSILRPKNNVCLSEQYLYHLLKRKVTQEYLLSYTNGTTVLHLSKKGLSSMPILIPDINLLNKFNTIEKKNFNLLQKYYKQSDILVKLKGLLLPKLITGKVRVSLEEGKES